ncbi:MAG: hypothetical protein V1859_03030 [archaeon]
MGEKRGRPFNSKIRQNIIEILYVLGKAYGYDIYKAYIKAFPKVTLRSIYYHLKTGVSLNEFKIDKIEHEKGNYSWGESAEKIYYSLGNMALPHGDAKLREILTKEEAANGSKQ